MSDHQDVLWTAAGLSLDDRVVIEKKTDLIRFNRFQFDT
jgi:hypothetical protein